MCIYSDVSLILTAGVSGEKILLKYMKRIIFVIVLAVGLVVSLKLDAGAVKQYGIAKKPTPVFNVADFKSLFEMSADRQNKFSDDCYHMKELEFIAFPGTPFVIEDTMNVNGITVDKVTIPKYPYPIDSGYYVDDRFVKHLNYEPQPKIIHLPFKKIIMNRMLAVQGERYTWGGNYHKGITDLSKLYDASNNRKIDVKIADRLKLKGLDCSGLLHEATGGYTPRNTSGLITFGSPVEIAGLGVDEIIQKIEPLDIIAWRGHVMVILDKDREIESREDYDQDAEGCQGGVRVRALKPVLEDLLINKIAVNNYDDPVPKDKKKFVIRRWYPKKFDLEEFVDKYRAQIGKSRQLIFVVNDKDKIEARILTYELDVNGWKQVFKPIPAVIGENGFALLSAKVEGDGKTPSGIYKIGPAFGFGEGVNTKMVYKRITDDDFWVDDPTSNQYNTWVYGKPEARSFEKMNIEPYRYGLVIQYNMHPIIKGKGSAIFLHVWRNKDRPTAGCVATSQNSTLKLLGWLDESKNPLIILGLGNSGGT